MALAARRGMNPKLCTLVLSLAIANTASAGTPGTLGLPRKSDVNAVVGALIGKSYGAIVERRGVIGYVGEAGFNQPRIITVQRSGSGRLLEIDRLVSGGKRVAIWYPDGRVVQFRDASYRATMSGSDKSVDQGSTKTFESERLSILQAFQNAAR